MQINLEDKNEQEVVKKIKKYTQDWEAYNKAQTTEKIHVQQIILELLSYINPEEGRKTKGRPCLPLDQKTFSILMYVYNCKSSRRSNADLLLAKRLNLINIVPHFNTVLKTLNDSEITGLLTGLIRLTALPLRSVEKQFAVDSTGFSTSLFENWFNVRTQKESKLRHWKKAHVLCGTKTNIIVGAKITNGTNADCPELIHLVENAIEYFTMEELCADKAYLSQNNLEACAKAKIIPFIPFKSNCNLVNMEEYGQKCIIFIMKIKKNLISTTTKGAILRLASI